MFLGLRTPVVLQSAILGMHSIVQRPVVVQGKIEARPMMYVALTYDHRLVDGREVSTHTRTHARTHSGLHVYSLHTMLNNGFPCENTKLTSFC
jgi:hypothetical protein